MSSGAAAEAAFDRLRRAFSVSLVQPLVQRESAVAVTSDRFPLGTLERCVRNAEVEGSTPFRSTVRNKKPFGENVEGFSYCWDESCVVEAGVQ